MTVKNLNGTSDNTCKCKGGWLAHWYNFKSQGKHDGLCAGKGCFQPVQYGGMFKRTVLLIKAGTLFLFATHATKRKEIMILKTVLNLCPLMSVKLAGVSQLYKV